MKTLYLIAAGCVLLTSLTFAQSKAVPVNSGDFGNTIHAYSTQALLARTGTDDTDHISLSRGDSLDRNPRTNVRCAPAPISSENTAICETVRQFSEAMESRSMSQLRQVWPIAGEWEKRMQAHFREFKGVTVKEDCPSEPKMTGAGRAELFCYEVITGRSVSNYLTAKWEFPITFVLSKEGGTWRLDYRKVTK